MDPYRRRIAGVLVAVAAASSLCGGWPNGLWSALPPWSRAHLAALSLVAAISTWALCFDWATDMTVTLWGHVISRDPPRPLAWALSEFCETVTAVLAGALSGTALGSLDALGLLYGLAGSLWVIIVPPRARKRYFRSTGHAPED